MKQKRNERNFQTPQRNDKINGEKPKKTKEQEALDKIQNSIKQKTLSAFL